MVEQYARAWLPHGYCLSWDWRLILANVTADMLIFASYFVIAGIVCLAYRQGHLGVLMTERTAPLWAAFILACGLTHAWSGFIIWQPVYVMDTVLKIATAAISMVTAFIAGRDLLKAMRA